MPNDVTYSTVEERDFEQRRRLRAEQSAAKILAEVRAPTVDDLVRERMGAVPPAAMRDRMTGSVVATPHAAFLDLGGPLDARVRAQAAADCRAELAAIATRIEAAVVAEPGLGLCRRAELAEKLAAARADESALAERSRSLQRDRDAAVARDDNPAAIDVQLQSVGVQLKATADYARGLADKIAAIDSRLGEARSMLAEQELATARAAALEREQDCRARVLALVQDHALFREWLAAVLVSQARPGDVVGLAAGGDAADQLERRRRRRAAAIAAEPGPREPVEAEAAPA